MLLNIPCVIFAGGKSSRMGEDKALLPFSSFTTLTEFQLFKLKQIFKTVYISCKDKSRFDFEANFIEDIEQEVLYAPTLGFIAAFEKIQEDSFFAISVDTPFVGRREIQKILTEDTKNLDACIAKTELGIHPLCGIYHRSLETNFLMMSEKNQHKLGYLLKTSQTKYIHFDNEQVFLNLNHPHEYKKALEILDSNINTTSL